MLIVEFNYIDHSVLAEMVSLEMHKVLALKVRCLRYSSNNNFKLFSYLFQLAAEQIPIALQ